jgi:hypothetical protein
VGPLKTTILLGFSGEMCVNSDKTEENRKKPVETEEIWLTKLTERLKVNCGTVLRTRMNTDDSHWKVSAALVGNRAGQASGPMNSIFESKKEQHTWQRE